MFLNIILIIVAAVFAYMWWVTRKSNKQAWVQHDGIVSEWAAAELGIQEIIENYENDLLQANENVERLGLLVLEQEGKIDTRDAIIAHHAAHCHSMAEIEYGRVLELFKDSCDHSLPHAHASYEKCDANACDTDRFADGTHIFTDKVIIATPH